MIHSHKITVPRTAHYYTIGTASENIRRFWLVCHGYGQLAESFIRRFEGLEDGQTLIVAPEGLNKFYWGQFTGPPVASWMTSHERLDEIADYCNYIQTLYQYYLPRLSPDVQIVLLGFSQGTATVCRWVVQHLPRFHHLVLWAGLLPDDLDFRPFQSYFSEKKLHFVYGTDDRFLTENRLRWQRHFARKNRLRLNEFSYQGKHEIDKDALWAFCGKL